MVWGARGEPGGLLERYLLEFMGWIHTEERPEPGATEGRSFMVALNQERGVAGFLY